jgi:catechol 2,3-dioxygenase-like lactoylglutathione lyase family enzyme
MIDHMSVTVFDIARSVAFYDAALKPLGFGRAMDFTAPDGSYRGVGYGLKDKPVFWLGAHLKDRKAVTPMPGFHVAFEAASRADVDAFYAAAIKAGARDNGAPGLRPHYHPNYYGAFVIDPDGYHLEAVCHRPE